MTKNRATNFSAARSQKIKLDAGMARRLAKQPPPKVITKKERTMSELADNPVLRALALSAGMHDADALKLLDLSDVVATTSGKVAVPAGFFEAARQAKPWAFGAVSTSSTSTKPQPQNGEPKKYTDMTAAEQASWRKQQGIRDGWR